MSQDVSKIEKSVENITAGVAKTANVEKTLSKTESLKSGIEILKQRGQEFMTKAVEFGKGILSGTVEKPTENGILEQETGEKIAEKNHELEDLTTKYKDKLKQILEESELPSDETNFIKEVGFPQVTEALYVNQTSERTCGVASILMARNILLGQPQPETIEDALKVMQESGYNQDKLGRTEKSDRSLLISGLNSRSEVKMKHETIKMPTDETAYLEEMQALLEKGSILLVSFVKPYFELPEGAEVTSSPDSAHGTVLHGLKSSADGKTITITDPDNRIAGRFGMNIDVSVDKFFSSLSNYSKNNMEIISKQS